MATFFQVLLLPRFGPSQVPGKYRDVVVRDNHVFAIAIATGSGRAVVYSDTSDLYNGVWQTFHQDKWVTLDYDPNSKHLCAFKKSNKIVCASEVDPTSGEICEWMVLS
jgi:hypothetical protein